MESITYIKYLRISPKKVKELAKMTRKLSPQEAINKLLFNSNKASRILVSIIKTALANATKNLKFDEAKLRIKTIETGKGPSFKRWNPVSRGMAHSIKKRTS